MRGPPVEKRALDGQAINHSTAALVEFKSIGKANQLKKDGEQKGIRNEPSLSSSSLPYLRDVMRGKHPSSITKSGGTIFQAIKKSDERRTKMKRGRRLHGVVEADLPVSFDKEKAAGDARQPNEERKKETRRLQRMTMNLKNKVRRMRKTRQMSKRRGNIVGGDMASAVASVRKQLIEVGDGKKSNQQVRVRNR